MRPAKFPRRFLRVTFSDYLFGELITQSLNVEMHPLSESLEYPHILRLICDLKGFGEQPANPVF